MYQLEASAGSCRVGGEAREPDCGLCTALGEIEFGLIKGYVSLSLHLPAQESSSHYVQLLIIVIRGKVDGSEGSAQPEQALAWA